MKTVARRLLGGAILSWILVSGLSSVAGPEPDVDLTIRVRPEAVEKLIAAAVPYDLILNAGVFEETVRLSNPRNLKFFAGGVRLQLTATGSPVAFSTTVEPVIRLEKEAATGIHRVRIESLPVRIGLAGTYDLAAFIPVIPIERVTEHLLETKEKDIPMQLEVREIRIEPDGIEILMQTSFR
jgi:hypothetical protein